MESKSFWLKIYVVFFTLALFPAIVSATGNVQRIVVQQQNAHCDVANVVVQQNVKVQREVIREVRTVNTVNTVNSAVFFKTQSFVPSRQVIRVRVR